MPINAGSIADFLLIGFLFLHLWLGWRSGLLWQSARMATIGFGIVLGLILTPFPSEWLQAYLVKDRTHANAIAFLLIAGGVAVLLRVIATWAEVSSEQGCAEEVKVRRRQDRILGSLFGGLKAAVLSMVLVAVCHSFWPQEKLWQESVLSHPLAQAGNRLLPQGTTHQVRSWIGSWLAPETPVPQLHTAEASRRP